MGSRTADIITKLKWSLPWLVRYPLWRARLAMQRNGNGDELVHIIFVIANHFEPGVGKQALGPVESWCRVALRTGETTRDHDGTPFRHTYFFPAEQYDYPALQMLAALQAEGFGEVEIHLHHGVDQPDSAANTRRLLKTFRDVLADEHRCLSRENPAWQPNYAFTHGNLALANSAGGRNCGVDSEMQILAETGCYADFTLPTAPDQSQVPKINAIYQCGHPLIKAVPHRAGPNLKVGIRPSLPVIFTGPLVFDWTRRVHGFPVPRIDDGALAKNYPLSISRFNRWRNAQIGVEGKPEWVFIKLYSHGFFAGDQEAMIGDQMRRFMGDVFELAEKTRSFKVHFASAREVFNMVIAAVDGQLGEPGQYRDYRLRQIMQESSVNEASPDTESKVATD